MNKFLEKNKLPIPTKEIETVCSTISIEEIKYIINILRTKNSTSEFYQTYSTDFSQWMLKIPPNYLYIGDSTSLPESRTYHSPYANSQHCSQEERGRKHNLSNSTMLSVPDQLSWFSVICLRILVTYCCQCIHSF